MISVIKTDTITGCSASDSANVAMLSVTLMNDTICMGDSSIVVATTNAASPTFVWSTGSITPSISPSSAGSYSVIVSDTSLGCTATDSMTLVVNSLPTVTFGALSGACVYNNPITLSQGSPVGGTYSGTGVNAGAFNPATAGVGTFTLSYMYTDANGCSNTATSSIFVDSCASINIVNLNNVKVYPNPSSGKITISFEGSEANVAIVNVNGKLVYNSAIKSNDAVDLSMLKAGTYFVKVEIENNTFVERIIIQ